MDQYEYGQVVNFLLYISSYSSVQLQLLINQLINGYVKVQKWKTR